MVSDDTAAVTYAMFGQGVGWFVPRTANTEPVWRFQVFMSGADTIAHDSQAQDEPVKSIAIGRRRSEHQQT